MIIDISSQGEVLREGFPSLAHLSIVLLWSIFMSYFQYKYIYIYIFMNILDHCQNQ